MGKREGDQATPQAQDQASQAQDVAGSEPVTTASPTAEAVEIAAPEVVALEAPKAEAPKADAPNLETATSTPPVTPPTAPPKVIAFERAAAREKAASAATTAAAATPAQPWQKMRRAMPFAAAIAITAVVGAMAGSAATTKLGAMWASAPAPVESADMRPLRDTITRMNRELVALKASIENSGRTSNVQLTRLGDRLDRVERAQAEPAAKLAKLADAVERIERRASAAPAIANDVTGSITAPATQPAAGSPARPSGPPILDGWHVRGVYHGAALIQTRYGGVIEVEPGDSLPGLGRIENIRRQDGRWVVLTSRGMIVAR